VRTHASDHTAQPALIALGDRSWTVSLVQERGDTAQNRDSKTGQVESPVFRISSHTPLYIYFVLNENVTQLGRSCWLILPFDSVLCADGVPRNPVQSESHRAGVVGAGRDIWHHVLLHTPEALPCSQRPRIQQSGHQPCDGWQHYQHHDSSPLDRWWTVPLDAGGVLCVGFEFRWACVWRGLSSPVLFVRSFGMCCVLTHQ